MKPAVMYLYFNLQDNGELVKQNNKFIILYIKVFWLSWLLWFYYFCFALCISGFNSNAASKQLYNNVNVGIFITTTQ